MKTHQFKLESLYQDLCHRYGAEDSAAQEVLHAIVAHKEKMAEMNVSERRVTAHAGHVSDRANEGQVRLY